MHWLWNISSSSDIILLYNDININKSADAVNNVISIFDTDNINTHTAVVISPQIFKAPELTNLMGLTYSI